MKILLIGSGGREYALGSKIYEADKSREIFFAPGNGGTEKIGKNIDIKADDINKLLEFAKEENIDYTVVGPEVPLCMGIVDKFEENNLKIFGPKYEGARFEESKAFTKAFLNKYNIKTAKYLETCDYEEALNYALMLFEENGIVVLKADGLAAGKGVLIAQSTDEIKSFLKEVLEDGKFDEKKVVIEEYLDGFEMSLICLVDNNKIIPLPTARDYKKIYDGESGPNTGGMGSYSPNFEADAYLKEINEEILIPIHKGLKKEHIDYRGVLFIGLMITDDGVNVLEFNVRFGDPETQSILEKIDNDLLELLQKTSENRLNEVNLKINNKKAMCLVLASGGYPSVYENNKEIKIGNLENVKLYHAGTKEENGKLFTNGGRVLNIVSSDDNFDSLIKKIYEEEKKIQFENKYSRSDIGPKVKRIYVKKKEDFDYESREILESIKTELGIKLDYLNVYRRYDIEIDNKTLENILYTILSERPVDEIFYGNEAMKLQADMNQSICVAYLPGQFDQREQGLLDTISLVSDERVSAKCSNVYEFAGASEEEVERIEKFLVNPVDSRRVNLLKIPTTLRSNSKINSKNEVYKGFINYNQEDLERFLEEHDLAMSIEDLVCLQDYFKKENRDPNETEVSIIDTYWSDHCRHTTFNTELVVDFDEKTELDKIIKEAFDKYLQMRKECNVTKPVTLMSLGTILAKYLRKNNKLEDLEVSSEINACSIKIKVRIEKDGKEELEDYLLMFKNETHNHPTEIEPLGGASTCLGGAIRDPLSGRAYVYQAMRITGSADPRKPLNDTLKGKLPQRKITREAARGYSSYGNQIGLATGFVDEIYHEGYMAKRMETGAVMAAAPMKNVKRIEPEDGDIVLLIGGRTGRDGIGGATGSSKSHKVSSIVTESAQVQKGNAPEERKIQRLFRREEVASLIKKCNDFGAGGVSVAIGELSDGVEIFLDRVPLKYQGLTPREIAISESQERMALVIAKKDYEDFKKYCEEENLEVTHVANIVDNNRMIMKFNDEIIVDMDYDFINSTGARREQKVIVASEDKPEILKSKDNDPENLYEKLKDLNITSKRNLIEIFDSTIGRNTVLNPLGGQKGYNPIQAMVAKVPSFKGDVKTVSLMSYGFNPYLMEESQFLGGYYAVIESITKLVATGAKSDKIRLSFQEYFEKMTDEKVWSKPLKALLGALEAAMIFDAPPIGGKDSMSGTFENISVPPTLISFAVTTSDIENIISPDFKVKGKIGVIETEMLEDGRINVEKLKENIKILEENIESKKIISAMALNKGILPQLFEMAAGNTGFKVEYDDLYSPKYGSFIVEYVDDLENVKEIGSFADYIEVNGVKLDMDKCLDAYLNTLNEIFKPVCDEKPQIRNNIKVSERRNKSIKTVKQPIVVIPAFPGTNCEWDTAAAFEKYGAKAEIFLFNNQNRDNIKKSLEEFAGMIKNAQILAIPGGFSLGDEPDGSGKFIANVIRSKEVSQAIDILRNENDGLILGICNGFQALVKTGLLPGGEITEVEDNDPTLTFNKCRRHIAKFVNTKPMTNNSPWLKYIDIDKTYKMPISHGEGRFVVNEEEYKKLLKNEQIVSVYDVAVNGSDYSIEGIMSEDGHILGKMGHAERVENNLYKNVYDIELFNIFKAGVDYFKED